MKYLVKCNGMYSTFNTEKEARDNAILLCKIDDNDAYVFTLVCTYTMKKEPSCKEEQKINPNPLRDFFSYGNGMKTYRDMGED